ncbi:MAG TPA: CapA family protein, partial [Burkholderiales bacterium]|nr:CapA family protein [Burkholderiales bacterium]
HLFEPYLSNAREYVRFAEKHGGKHFHLPMDYDYIWGDALEELSRLQPDLRIINLETAVTTSEHHQPDKAIHYRMHPANVSVLTAAAIDCCVLANNHVLDWGYSGLSETIKSLENSGIATVGAGDSNVKASAPAILMTQDKGRLIIFAYGMKNSGVPPAWAAGQNRPGVNYLEDFSKHSLENICQHVGSKKREKDVVVVSLHWGENWNYDISSAQRDFAHHLIDLAGIDIIYGHSSHHVKGIEVYHEHLVLYGCGDFINDYEGISGYEKYRGDLSIMYFPTLDVTNGQLLCLTMIPTYIHMFKVNRASEEDAQWLFEKLNTMGKTLGTSISQQTDGSFILAWQ